MSGVLHTQLFLLRWGLNNFLPRLASNCHLPVSAFWEVGITGINHHTWLCVLNKVICNALWLKSPSPYLEMITIWSCKTHSCVYTFATFFFHVVLYM
jgi:hypothetical protein